MLVICYMLYSYMLGKVKVREFLAQGKHLQEVNFYIIYYHYYQYFYVME